MRYVAKMSGFAAKQITSQALTDVIGIKMLGGT